MTFEIPKDLIERVQILLRKEAGVDESYRPGDPSVNLPSVEEVIASFDPSPDDQRCERCKGKLLRGVDSMNCVYCGTEQQKESPQPISFTSTIGYRWLLDSLGLDGSEMMTLVNEGMQNNRKPSSMKDEVVLSDFLNLEMEWPVGLERFGTNDTDEVEVEELRPLHLVGVGSDESISEPKSENISTFTPEQGISTEQTQFKENKTFQDEEDSSFSGWQADFQPASPSAESINLDSSHIPQSKDSLSKVTVPIQPSIVGTIPENVVMHSTEPFNLSSADVSYEIPLQSNGMDSVKAVNDMRTNSAGSDDFSDAWNDFTGSVNQQQERGVEKPDEDSSDTWDTFISSGAPTKSRNVSVSKMTDGCSEYPLDAWDEFASFSSAKQESSGAGPTEEHETVSHTDSLGLWSDFPGSERKDDTSKNWLMQSRDESSIKQGDNSLDLWDGFVGQAVQNVGEESKNLESAGTQMDGNSDHAADPWGDFMSLHNPSPELGGKALGTKDKNNDIDPSDLWSGFGSSVMMVNDNKLTTEDSKATVDSSLKSTSQAAESIGQPSDNKSTSEDDLFDSWGAFSSSAAVGTRASENEMAEKDDPFRSWDGFGISNIEKEQWQKSEPKATQDHFLNGWSSSITASGSDLGTVGDLDPKLKASKDDNSFDTWSSFTTSANVQSNLLEVRKGSTPGDGKALQAPSVPFDNWDMLFSSPSASKSYQNGALGEHSSDPSLLSSAFESHDSELRSSRPSEIPIPVRNGAKITGTWEDEAEEPKTKEKPVDAEQLISQMPDLGFMLEDSLSVPKAK